MERLARHLALLTLLWPAALSAQQRVIAGRVVDAMDGRPLPSVAVTVTETRQTVLSDAEGRFRLVGVPSGRISLRFSTIGYRSTTVAVEPDAQSIEVGLETDVLNLDALVVTGQATTIDRRSATTSIAYVSGEQVSRVSSPTALNAMAGKITGVNLQTNSGAPGGGIQMQIRGNSTILGSFDPLFVVDGVIYSNASIPSGRGYVNAAASPELEADPVNRIADLNPSDIASIEVLKGAAASAIYGSKAANGVVIITTKRGQAGPPQVEVTQRVGVFTPLRLLSFRRWTLDEAVAKYGESARPFFQGNQSPYYDHYAQVYSNRRPSYETIATVRGGSEATRYYVSGAWKHDEGIERGTFATRQSLRANLDQRLGTRTDIQVSTAFARSENDRGWDNNCNNFGCHGYAIAYIPSFIDLTRRNPDGSFPTPPQDIGVQANPIQHTELGVNLEETIRFTGGIRLSWDAMQRADQALRLVVGGGIDAFDQENDVWSPNELFFEQSQTRPGEAVQSGGRSLFYNWNVNAIHTFLAPSFTATTSFGLQYEDQRLHTHLIRTQGLLPGQRNVDQGTFTTTDESLSEERTLAVYLQEELQLLDERLLILGGLRAERSSVNGDAGRYYVFPKLSSSYRIPGLLGNASEIKLRAAYGETGNQPLFGMKYTDLETPQIGGEKGVAVSATAGSPVVEPERVKEVEVGIDGFMMNGRLTWELTAFTRNTTNLLLERVPAPSTGYAEQIFNGGKLRNDGFEIALGYAPIQTRDALWVARATFTRYTSEVVDLAGLPPFYPTGSGFGNLGRTYVEEGKPITQIVALAYDKDGNVTSRQVQVGNSAPDFRVGLVNDVAFGRLGFSSTLDWQQGGNAINLTKYLSDTQETSPDYGTPAFERRAAARRDGVHQPYVEDATFVKLREVSITWDVPESLYAGMGIGVRDLRLGLSGRNVLMWTKYSGLDPEVANFGPAAIRSNLDIAPYPPSRAFFLEITVGF
ncbi:MAG TPA: SusC/RagA family TonB-linked outer membrane protein [Longimicrobiales bacterium]